MAADANTGGSRKHSVVLDFTRIDDLNNTKRIFLNIRDEDNVSVLVNNNSISGYIFDSQKAYNLYGYAPIDFKGNTFINYAIDLARMDKTYLDKKNKNRYLNYKYANHYPVPMSNWNKFSRFKLDYLAYSRIASICTHDFYSLLSIFDSINQYKYHNFLLLDNSNYKDFNNNNSNSNEYVDKPIEYHGRNIYIDKKFIYLKVNDAADIIATNVVASKYMVVELDGFANNSVRLQGIFSLCNTHAYIVNNPTNKLNINPEYLLAWCNATKFGDISDERTILNLTNIKNISGLCNFSNVEDLSMHTIKMDRSAEYISMTFAFNESKIKKLPAGLVESLDRGFKNLSAIDAFKNAKNIEIDISKINIPTLGSEPSNYNLKSMYEGSNCRHINRSIISKNDNDIINTEYMYKDTTLIEDTPLPEGMFKNYKNIHGIFTNTIFENIDTFKYIYIESAKVTPFTTIIDSAIKADNRPSYKIECPIISFRLSAKKIEDTIENLSIIGDKKTLTGLTIHADRCVSLDVGIRLSKLKELMERRKSDTSVHHLREEILPEYDFVIEHIERRSSTVSERSFFMTLVPPRYATRYIDKYCPIFRSIRFLMCGENYYSLYENIFKQIFSKPVAAVYKPDGHRYDRTSVLFCLSNTRPNMMTLSELSDDKYMSVLKEDLVEYCNACATISINGLHTKWTAYRPHINKFTKENRYISNIIGRDVDGFFDYISVFTDAVHLKKCIMAQMVMTPTLSAENKIEFIFKARDNYELVRFLKLMDEYLALNNESDKPVGRFLLIYNGSVYDSSYDIPRVLYNIGTEHAESAKADLATVDNYWE